MFFPRLVSKPLGSFLILTISLLLACHSASAGSLQELLAAPDVRPGLLVVLGVTPGQPVTLAHDGKFLVQGLTDDPATLAGVRQEIAQAGRAAKISANLYDPHHLPYADNLVNVLVVEDFASAASKGLTLAEVYRVLAPYGSAFLKGVSVDQVRKEFPAGADQPKVTAVSGWVRLDKPYPAAMDVWGQYGHDPAATFVSQDRVAGPLENIRWIAGDKFVTGRYVSPNVISADGRVFFLNHDHGYAGGVECRDAFNGRLLWKTSPTEGVRAFIASGERLYVLKQKVEVWDARTGKLLLDFKNENPAWPVFLLDPATNVLVLGCSYRNWLKGYDAQTGRELWSTSGLPKASGHRHAVIGSPRLYYVWVRTEGEGPAQKTRCSIRGLNLKTGQQEADFPEVFTDQDLSPTLGQYLDGKLIVNCVPKEAKWKGQVETRVVSADTGRVLWQTRTTASLVSRDGGFLYAQNLFWNIVQDSDLQGLDPATGTIKKTLAPKHHHTGCDPMVATVNYLIGARMHLVDLLTGEIFRYTATRTPCRDSCRPANGLIYFPRHTCPCTNPMNGNLAISSQSQLPKEILPEDAPVRFERGPAFGTKEDLALTPPDDWPTYRANRLRGSYVPTVLPAALTRLWETAVGSDASAPVIAGGRVYVTVPAEQRVVAMNEADGKILWSFTTGARVDSPPTLCRGLAVFGGRDGWVYALRAADGALAWRFRAAPGDRQILVQEQLESIWPVFGSVLLENGLLYASAGRHVDIDGGLWVYALEPASGKVVWKKQVRNPDHKTEHAISATLRGEGAVNDILRSDGRHAYLAGCFQKVAFDLKTGTRVYKPENLDREETLAGVKNGHNGVTSGTPDQAPDGASVQTFTGPGIVTQWLLLGPFPNPEGKSRDTDYLAALGGEAKARLTPQTKVPFKNPNGAADSAETLVLQADAATGLVSPKGPYAKGAKEKIAYAQCLIRSDADRRISGIYSATGGEKIWVNGALVSSRLPMRRLINEAQDRFAFDLRKGLNTVLIKMESGVQGWVFSLILTDAPPMPILSTTNDLLLPAAHRALSGEWGDPTNSSAVWVYHPNPDCVGMAWNKEDRFRLAPFRGYAGDLLAFDGERVFGAGREQDAKRTALKIFGRPSPQAPIWFADPGDEVDHLQGLAVTKNVVAVAFGGSYRVGEKTETRGKVLLFAVEDGKQLGEVKLPAVPCWDGLAAANGKLFVTTADGKVICFSTSVK